MTTTPIDHNGLTELFTRVCEHKTDWDVAPLLYVLERERDNTGSYYLTPMSIISDDMVDVAEATGLPFPIILDRYADVMEMTHEARPDLKPQANTMTSSASPTPAKPSKPKPMTTATPSTNPHTPTTSPTTPTASKSSRWPHTPSTGTPTPTPSNDPAATTTTTANP